MTCFEYAVVHDDLIEETPLFPMSWGPDRPNLKESLGRAGQIIPLVLKPEGDRYQLVCGFRRRRILRELGCLEFQALILPAQTTTVQALLLALEDNLGLRVPNDAEKVLMLTALAGHLPLNDLVRQYLPRLDLPPRAEYLNRFLGLGLLGHRGLDLLADGRLDADTGEIILNLPTPEDRAAALDLLDDLQPGRNKRRELLGWLEEVARLEDRSVAEVIKQDDLRDILTSDRLNKPQKEQKVRRWLRHRRFPQLTSLEQKQAALLRALPLTDQIALTPPRNFEGLEFSLQINFHDLDELREQAQTLQNLLNDQRLAELVDLG
jgi:hypothetical protein